jgi:hypothetical protein
MATAKKPPKAEAAPPAAAPAPAPAEAAAAPAPAPAPADAATAPAPAAATASPPPADDLYGVISPLTYGADAKRYEIGGEVRMPAEHAKDLLGHTITKRA